MKQRLPSLLALVSLSIVVFAASPLPAFAQPAGAASPTTRSQVQVVRIKPDMLNEWIDLQRNEVVPALKKAGIKQRTVLATVVGNGFEYTLLTPFDKFAILDNPGPLVAALGAEAAARLNAKLRKCIETQRNYMANRVVDVDIPPGDALVSRMVVRRVPPGRAQDYVSFYRSDIFPALKKAKADGKIAGATIALRGLGAQANEVTTTEYYNKFADLDAGSPVLAVVGAEANAKINAKGAPLGTTVQVVLRRRVADLSF